MLKHIRYVSGMCRGTRFDIAFTVCRHTEIVEVLASLAIIMKVTTWKVALGELLKSHRRKIGRFCSSI